MRSSTLAFASPKVTRPSSLRRAVNPRVVVGGGVCLLALVCALFAPLLAPFDPDAQNLLGRIRPPGWSDPEGGLHLLGTDQLGRDLFSRIIYGTRISLSIAMAAASLSALVGVSVGMLGGYFGGLLDLALARVVDMVLAFPALLLSLALLAALRPSVLSVIVVLVVTGWVTHARLVRAQVLGLRQQEFVVAVQALGGNDRRIILRHLLPNLVPVIVVIVTIQFAQFILAEAALSFLGLGVPPTLPSWGGAINEGRDYILNAWWIETFPGLAIVVMVSGLGLLGDWLRERVDPRLRV